MYINQLTEQEQVLVNAFRNMHPDHRLMMLEQSKELALDFVQTSPQLLLVADNLAPSNVSYLRRTSGR
jgi:hypothetical protein